VQDEVEGVHRVLDHRFFPGQPVGVPGEVLGALLEGTSKSFRLGARHAKEHGSDCRDHLSERGVGQRQVERWQRVEQPRQHQRGPVKGFEEEQGPRRRPRHVFARLHWREQLREPLLRLGLTHRAAVCERSRRGF